VVLPSINFFYYDRIWFIAYPYPFSKPSKYKKPCDKIDGEKEEFVRVVDKEKNICVVKNKEKIKEIVDLFKKYGKRWTENAYRMYRTLKGIQLGLKKVDKCKEDKNCEWRKEDITPDKVLEILKYGKRDIYNFVQKNGMFCIKIPFELESSGITKFKSKEVCFSEDQIRSLVFHIHTDKYGNRHEEIVYRHNDYITVIIRPNPESLFKPHFIRVLVNGVIWAKKKLNLDIDMSSIYDYEHNNFIDHTLMSEEKFKEFLKVNHSILFELRNEIIELVKDLLLNWFGFESTAERWLIVLSSMELAFDSYEPKEKLISIGYYVEAESKGAKADIKRHRKNQYNDNLFVDTKMGLKLYITVKGGRNHLQMKIYTKAFNKVKGKPLNRLEYTIGIHKPINDSKKPLKESDIYREDLLEVHKIAVRVSRLESNKFLNVLIRELSVFTKECENYSFYDRCVEFWIDMILAKGVLKGNEYYRDVARLYKKKGYIEIRGRGKNSKYVVSPRYRFVVKSLLKVVSKYMRFYTKKLKPSPYTLTPQNQ